MARKSYSDKEREQVKEALLITVLESIVNQGLVHSSIAILCEKVGISKTFFYSFFSSKEELVMQALRYQQPKLLRYAQELMNDPKLSWRESVKTFLKNCCYGEKVGFAVLSIEEEQQVYRCLSNENFQAFRNDQLYLYRNLLTIFGSGMNTRQKRCAKRFRRVIISLSTPKTAQTKRQGGPAWKINSSAANTFYT